MDRGLFHYAISPPPLLLLKRYFKNSLKNITELASLSRIWQKSKRKILSNQQELELWLILGRIWQMFYIIEKKKKKIKTMRIKIEKGLQKGLRRLRRRCWSRLCCLLSARILGFLFTIILNMNSKFFYLCVSNYMSKKTYQDSQKSK